MPPSSKYLQAKLFYIFPVIAKISLFRGLLKIKSFSPQFFRNFGFYSVVKSGEDLEFRIAYSFRIEIEFAKKQSTVGKDPQSIYK